MKKILLFLVLFAYAVGAVGGPAYLLYYDQPLFAVLVIMIDLMALPLTKQLWKELGS